MKRRLTAITLVFCMLAVQLLCGFKPLPEHVAENGRIRGTMYFGHEWAVDFWSGEHAYAAEDFSVIAGDGFNTVIFVVPWRAFQPDVRTRQFNGQMLDRLEALIEEADRAGLKVMLRLGYTWDDAPGEAVLTRFTGLVSDHGIYESWLSYAEKIWKTVSKHDNFIGAFLTWEDFWNYLTTVENYAEKHNYEAAKASGFVDYVLSHYEEEELQALYGNPQDAKTAPFPERQSPAFRLVFEWYDEFLNQLLKDTQEVFPDLSMECRLHHDPYESGEEGNIGYSHAATFGCGDSSYNSVMLSVDMGALEGTSGSTVATQQASLLGGVGAVAGKPVFVDQFLYDESTPGYEDAPHISDDVNDYLRAMGNVFNDKTIGYSVWSWRDYADNIVYNMEFGMGLSGWMPRGEVSVVEEDGNHMARMGEGSALMQNFGQRYYLSDKPTKVQFRVIAEEDTTLTVTVGGQTENRNLEAGDQVVDIEYPACTAGNFSISTSKEITIDDVKVYSHITTTGIYDLNGEPAPYLEGIRTLNAEVH